MDDRWLNNQPPEMVKRRRGRYGPKYLDVEDFLAHEFKMVSKMQFPAETSGAATVQYTFTMVEKHSDYAVFDVEQVISYQDGGEGRLTHRVYLTVRAWEGMKDILGPQPYTVQKEGNRDPLRQLNAGTFAFSKFFGLCHCDLLDTE